MFLLKKRPCPAKSVYNVVSKHFNSSTIKVKCWEYWKCDPAKCLVFITQNGRGCWLIAQDCNKKFIGIHTKTISSCKDCQFYKEVKSGDI